MRKTWAYRDVFIQWNIRGYTVIDNGQFGGVDDPRVKYVRMSKIEL